ncbi:kinesin-domain-containing protein [Basidiobolus meristosporus CBS 931.73]|uniref:Kinesin-like protein n=1 Tax=Basidiobolus meristosporus CBS 931.73 TaxID=1314790 RepID=A0A1Y1XYK7_9FUNG|nr:kinesin-domain-containing protein [Basidiobolus meristosporus CBS 931.73]|eukprot:ORX90444.1 kinesin-domain-containing protein [Basidiobolus meristosporus CBS 931.73]
MSRPETPNSVDTNVGHSRRPGELRRKADQADKESNVQVVVRCRGRNEIELRDNSPLVVNVSGKDILVKIGSGDKNSRPYAFDRTFGPEADQSLLYNSIVEPFLGEVLNGYNCTIFAYGQTGTGKTYTMEGNMDEVNQTFTEEAGIIPRTLFNLFDRLEKEKAEFSVRLSFVELYNEELKDLLGPDDDSKKLRIFEDSSKKGTVVIQGLEEIHANNAMEGISLLQRGSLRRKIAATNDNDKSSRSHSVFTITVHRKQSVLGGEDLLTVGKLNLVDLAGSENIGRSGAENKRAREAGMINQSLLTLGRVINSLVERSPHIPYRESKLTRLLQDSLGGRTKTCIIATISPAKSNIDETLSTLEYANKAKNIKNKPQANQRMSKKALIKEYITEIERLKSELMAAREKEGVYLPMDGYQSLLDENQSRADQIVELNKHAESIQEQLASLTQEFQQKMNILAETKTRLANTEEQLNFTSKSLANTSRTLEDTKVSLAEQVVLTRAHAETEEKLNKTASELLSVLEGSIEDIHNLHAKIERKDGVESENRQLLQTFQEDLTSQADKLNSDITQFAQAQIEFVDGCVQKMDNFVKQRIESLQNKLQLADSTLQQLNENSQAIDEHAKAHQTTVETRHGEFDALRLEMQKFAQQFTEEFRQTSGQLFDDIKSELGKQKTQILDVYHDIEGGVESILTSTKSHLVAQQEYIHDFMETVDAAATEEISQLKLQIVQLSELLEADRVNSEADQDSLIQGISSLIEGFSEEHVEGFQHLVDSVVTTNSTNASTMQTFGSNFEATTKQAGEEIETFIQSLNESSTKATEELRAMSESIEQHSQNLDVASTHVQSTLNTHVEELNTSVSKNLDELSESNAESLAVSQQYIKDNKEALSKLSALISEDLQASKSAFKDLQNDLSKHENERTALFTENKDMLNSFYSSAFEQLMASKRDINCLVNEKIKMDISTGQTPKRRKYELPKWRLTKPDDQILREYRERSTTELES